MKMNSPIFVGVDFGAAFTRIVSGLHPSDLEALDYYGVPSHPSGVAFDGARAQWQIGRGWETSLSTSSPLQNCNQPRLALERIAQNSTGDKSNWSSAPEFDAVQRLFLRLSTQIQESQRGESSGSGGAALCLPAHASPALRAALSKAVALPNLAFISSAEAAILGFEVAARIDERPRLVAVWEGGASGSRATILEVRKRQGFLSARLLGAAEDGDCSGNALDLQLWQRYLKRHPEAEAAFNALPSLERQLARDEALWAIHNLRLRLSQSRDAGVEVTLSRLDKQVLKLERLLVESAVEDVVLQAGALLDAALKSAQIGADELYTLMPVGGLTRLPGLLTMLRRRVPYLESTSTILTTSTDLLAPARGAARHAMALGAQSQGIRFVPMELPLVGVRVGESIDPILPINAPHNTRRTKVYTASHPNADGVTFEIWSGFSPAIASATKIGEVQVPFDDPGSFNLNQIPLQVALERRKNENGAQISVEIQSLELLGSPQTLKTPIMRRDLFADAAQS